jgi:opacity protein-like surface antigen
MRRNVILIALLSFGILAGTSLPAQAAGGFYLGPYFGYSAQKPTLTGVEFNTDTTFLYGARIGFKFLMLSVEANYFKAAHNLRLKEFITFEWGGQEIDYQYLGINAKIYFPFLFIHPYLTGGYGYYTADITTIGRDTERGFNVGLGLEIRIGKKFSLLAEGKYHRVGVDIQTRKLKLGDFTLAGGFNIYL